MAGDCSSTKNKRWNRSRDLTHRPLDQSNNNPGRRNIQASRQASTPFVACYTRLDCVGLCRPPSDEGREEGKEEGGSPPIEIKAEERKELFAARQKLGE